MVQSGRAAQLRVSGRMLDEKGRVTLVVVFNDDAIVQFTGKEVHFRQGGKDWGVTSEWEVTQDSKKKPVTLPFDAPLPRTSYYGSYTAQLLFPDGLYPTQPFDVILPATAAQPGATITFTPKVADFWYRPGV